MCSGRCELNIVSSIDDGYGCQFDGYCFLSIYYDGFVGMVGEGD